MKKCIVILNGTNIEDEQGNFIGVLGGNIELREAKEEDEKRMRVKQALKLKDAGFTGKEIIDIIGEIE